MDNSEVFKFFPEPVFKYNFKNSAKYNSKLSDYIYKLYEKDSNGINRSNRGGWHSENFELKDSNSIQFKFAIELQEYILNTFQNLGWKTENQNIRIKEMWAIKNKKNEFNSQVVGVEVKEGDLLIFPGYLPHKVAKNKSSKDRIVISFNVDIK